MKSGNGIGVGTVLFLVFLVLKVTGQIDWSWWWVFSPLWIGGAIALVVMVSAIVVLSRKGR